MTRLLSHFTQRRVAVALGCAALLCTTSCGDKVLQGKASSYLIVTTLQAAKGNDPTKFSATLDSDVLTKGSIYEDIGQVSLRLALKDPVSGIAPTDTNSITVERYHVEFVRSDGRNTQGVDVPFAFDGASTATVSTNGAIVSFPIVRVQAKVEAPLMALRNMGGALAISTIATITFYGHDQAGNAVSVSGQMSITFADWADPE